MLEGFDAAFAMVEGDKEIRAVIVRGEGRAFCSGLDLRDIDQIGTGGVTPGKVFAGLAKLSVPTIAAIHGDALTGGVVPALPCRPRIATPNAGVAINSAANWYTSPSHPF